MIELEVLGNDPIELEVTMPSGGGFIPSGTKQVVITENGTYTEDVYNFANAEIDVNVPTVTPTGTKSISIVTNGTTTEDVENYADAEITVNVPNSYTASDEGKVVNNGALTSQTSATYTENDTYDTTLIDEVTINVTGATINNQDKTVTPTTSQQSVTADSGYTGLGTVTVEAMPSGTEGTPVATKGAVSNHSVDVTPNVTNTEGYIAGGTKTGTAVTVTASELVSGTKQISANGSDIDVTNYESVDVSVPNSYSASDEGKVVSNGALVSQSSATYTANDTYDTTLIDEVTVNVSGGSGDSKYTELVAILNHTLNTTLDFVNNDIVNVRDGFFSGLNNSNHITSISMANLNSAPNNAFYQLGVLQRVYLPKVASVGQTAFGYCNNANFTTLALPSLKTVGAQAFRNMKIVSFDMLGGSDGSFGGSSFVACSNLNVFIIRADSVTPLGNINNFNNTPFASGGTGGTLYVPSALISSYQSATNWSTILGYTNNSIVAIEGSQYENYYADGTPISS